MRGWVAALALLPAMPALAVAAGGLRSGVACPGRACVDVLSVSVSPPRQPGAIFVAILPLVGDEPSLPGAFFLPDSSIAVSEQPVPAREGVLSPFRQQYRIAGGVCGLAAREGVSGRLAAYAGYGVIPPAMQEQLATLDAQIEALAPDAVAVASEGVERARTDNSPARIAAASMIADGTFWRIATIDCGDSR